ncbi:transcriptional regulator [Streptomyces canus]|uniref:transcriptional regulator n=1 Tax=Streptomyces canus TaxID=58343 RepID=UPI00277EE3EF|nr:transcriptional regulator [Streptomyces canus]MDQ0757790.1 hypothetical protein [Streptomyces canus]MDQ1073287.1 hypothetical protein [Streptomyces canus]
MLTVACESGIRCRILLALRRRPSARPTSPTPVGAWLTRPPHDLACLRDCGPVGTVSYGCRSRYKIADERIGHALDQLRAAVVVVKADQAGADAWSKGYC